MRITVFVQEFAVHTCKTPIDTCNGVSMKKQQPAILQSDRSIARGCGLRDLRRFNLSVGRRRHDENEEVEIGRGDYR